MQPASLSDLIIQQIVFANSRLSDLLKFPFVWAANKKESVRKVRVTVELKPYI